MKITKPAVAGTLESSDILVTLEPCNRGISIKLSSIVEKQFGTAIREEIIKTLQELDINSVLVTAIDKGALDCTIRARVKTAVYRAAEISLQGGGDNK